MAGIVKKQPCPCCKQPAAKGLASTFGGAPRFSRKNVAYHGSESVSGDNYYANSPYTTESGKDVRNISFGMSNRPSYSKMSTDPHVGPQSYTFKLSHARSKSALDGAEFSTIKMNPRRTYCVGQAPLKDQANFPGPGSYRTSSADSVRYSIRLPILDPDHHSGNSIMTEQGNLDGAHWSFCREERKGDSKILKESMSPNGSHYYSHSKLPSAKEYLEEMRSCSFGFGKRGGFGGSEFAVGPGSYDLRKESCHRCDSTVSI